MRALGALILALTAPAPIAVSHRVEAFHCTHVALTDWLKEKALKNRASGASRCFVVCDAHRVVGYYGLAVGSVEQAHAAGNVRRNMPQPIPVVVLGRLAVHGDFAGRGIGAGLLKDAVLRSQRAALEIGVRALLCHAIDESAKAFYLHHGFVESPTDRLTLMLKLDTAGGGDK
jgi:GNAT superfamily N-acetyltransferase